MARPLVTAGNIPKLKLTYFNIQGAAEKVRLAFVLGAVPFDDVRVPFPEWPALKPTTPYGQLPLLTIDDGEPMAQSDAMLRYAGVLAQANGVFLYPPANMLVVEEALGLVGDLSRAWRTPVGIGINPTGYGYPADFKGTDAHAVVVKSVRENFVAEALPKYMGFLQTRLAGSGGFLCGPAPTIADAALVPILNRLRCGQVDHVPTDCLDAHIEVCAYLERFMAIPQVKSYYDAQSQ